MPDIRDITDPSEFIPEPATPWWVWALVACGAVLLIVAVILIIRKRKPARSRRTHLDEARAKLAALRHDAAKLPPETVATRASIIIRSYLESAFEDPALFETSEEFTLRQDALQNLHPGTRTQITQHLQQLSDLKYEPNTSNETARSRVTGLVGEAEELLAQIELHPTPRHPSPPTPAS